MNRKVRRMMNEIERRGGMVHIDRNMPDDMAEEFLQQILSCPDCQHPDDDLESLFDPEEASIDLVLAGTIVPRRYGGH